MDDNTKLDIAFLLDGSLAITKDNFINFLSFVKSTSASLNVSKEGTHVALAVYGDKAELIIDFNYHYNQSSLDNVVDGIVYPGTRLSNMGAGLSSVISAFNSGVARPNATKALVILTASKSQDDIEVPSHDLLANKKVKLFTVGVGTEYSNGQLKQISSDPDESFVITYSSGKRLPMEIVSFKDTLAKGTLTLLRLPFERFMYLISVFLQSKYPLMDDDSVKALLLTTNSWDAVNETGRN